MITLKIPTSIAEIKEAFNARKSKRARCNREVIYQLQKDVYNVLNDGYWRDHISDTFKECMVNSGDKNLCDCFNKALKNLR